MARPETYLAVEDSLIRALRRAWLAESAETELRILAALRADDFTGARLLNRKLDMHALAEANRGRIESAALSAYMLGQSFAAGSVAEGNLARGAEELPPQIAVMADGLVRGLQDASAVVQERVAKVIAQEEEALERRQADREVIQAHDLVQVQKAVDQALSLALQRAVATGGSVIDVGANLTTTRLAAFGALTQMGAMGMARYQITEVLDAVTCPVCRRMHGRVFSVQQPLARLEHQLLNPNPAEIAQATPFPSQSRAGLVTLTSKTRAELQAKGWDTPPFHPRCRGLLSLVGTVPPEQMVPWAPPPELDEAVEAVEELAAPKLPARLRKVSRDLEAKIKGPKAVQELDDLDALYAQADEADAVLRQTVTDLADDLGGEAVFPPGLKSRARVVEKANAKYGGNVSAITDFSRATLQFEDLENVYQALGSLEKRGLQIVRINDRFAAPTAEGYSDVILGVKMPNGHVSELQLHVKNMRLAKEANHALYERQRSLVALAKSEGRALSPAELEELDRLVAEQRRAYAAALRGAL